jgi:hypothetical protein
LAFGFSACSYDSALDSINNVVAAMSSLPLSLSNRDSDDIEEEMLGSIKDLIRSVKGHPSESAGDAVVSHERSIRPYMPVHTDYSPEEANMVAEVTKHPSSLRWAPMSFKSCRAVVCAAVEQDGKLLLAPS